MARKAFERPKTPAEVIDYMINWKRRMKNDVIVSSVWTRDAADTSAVEVERTSFSTTTATIWFRGGISGHKALFTNTVTTAAGRVLQSPISLQIKV